MLKKIMCVLFILIFFLSFIEVAEAKRFGAGNNHGYSKIHSQKIPSTTKTTNMKEPLRNIMSGTFGKILTAFGIGALLSWLFSFHSSGSELFLLMILFIFGGIIFFMYFMRKKNTPIIIDQKENKKNNEYTFVDNIFNNKEDIISNNETQIHSNNEKINNNSLPDGTAINLFNNQVLNIFFTVQLSNNIRGLTKIKDMITNELFDSVKNNIEENKDIPEFKNIKSQIIDFNHNNEESRASVKFMGEIQENKLSSLSNFEEIWHFIRKDGEHLWKVSGIQQC